MIVSWPITRVTARERGLAPRTLVVAALLTLIALSGPVAVDPTGWFRGFGEFWFFALTLLLGAGILSDEVDSGHAQLVLLRPVTRAAWVGGRLLGVALVLGAVGVLVWAASFVSAVARGAGDPIGFRAAMLPIGILPHLGWLVVLVALSAVLRGWANVGVLLAARIGWVMARAALPSLLPNLDLSGLLGAVNRWFGPQEAVAGPTLLWGEVAWDVVFIALAWLAAVALFRKRELARRRS